MLCIRLFFSLQVVFENIKVPPSSIDLKSKLKALKSFEEIDSKWWKEELQRPIRQSS